jgi:hypothetical protein
MNAQSHGRAAGLGLEESNVESCRAKSLFLTPAITARTPAGRRLSCFLQSAVDPTSNIE